jgi:spore coat-associated protein N
MGMKVLIKTIIKNKLNWILLYMLTLSLGTNLIGETTALFTDSAQASNNSIQSAIINITATPASEIFNITDMLPGDTVTRDVYVNNAGSADFTYKVNNTGMGTLLWTDTANGLQLTMKEGTTVYYNGPLSELNDNNASDFTLPEGQTDILTLIVTLPTSADNTFQGLTETITFSFDATQVAGTSR